MGLQHDQPIPPSFSQAGDDKYLGNPTTVAGLVGAFLADTEAGLRDLGAGRVDGKHFQEAQRRRILDAAEIFAGRNPAYSVAMGWNSASLAGRVMQQLGAFWGMHRDEWAGDALAVLFLWLTGKLAESWKAADGDDEQLAIALRPALQQVNRLLLGVRPSA